MAKSPFSRKLTAVVAIAAAVSVAATVASLFSLRKALRTADEGRFKHAEDLVLSHELAQVLERKLAKSRSFLLTGDETFAQEMEDARSEFNSVLGELNGSIRSEEGRALLGQIRVLERRHHEILRQVMARRRGGARPMTLTPMLVEMLKPVRDELDRTLDQLIEMKQSQLQRAEIASDQSTRLAEVVSVGAGVVSLAAFLVVLWLVRRLAAAQLEVERVLRRSNAELDDLVAARTRELSAFNHELESFSYSVAHDLRTPLRAITNYAELAAAQTVSLNEPSLRDNVERIRMAGLRMGRLIDGLLALSRLTRRPMNPGEIDLSALAKEIGGEIAAANPARTVKFSVEPGLTDVADADLIRAALYNLIDNAWKFTAGRPEAKVEFGRTSEGEAQCYFVRDNGAGFDERFAQKLFVPFERLHSAREFPGTGVGLATVERIVRRHGGSVWAEGRPGQGATFYFTLNRRLPEKERAAPPGEDAGA